MTMTFSLHDSIDPNGAFELYTSHTSDTQPAAGTASREDFHILKEKLRVPEHGSLVDRPRMTELLKSSQGRFPATLITGRAGTGKTAIAAAYAAKSPKISWYSVESTDSDWRVFSRYFSESLEPSVYGPPPASVERLYESNADQQDVARFLINRFSQTYSGPPSGPSLIVLDDIHHIFDTPWFEDFFSLLLHSLPYEHHLLLLCRTKPPGPLWRLRSKQMLNVLDEKVIAFTSEEAGDLFRSIGAVPMSVDAVNQQCFGRVSKLIQSAA